jgi:adenylate cyclase class IV
VSRHTVQTLGSFAHEEISVSIKADRAQLKESFLDTIKQLWQQKPDIEPKGYTKQLLQLIPLDETVMISLFLTHNL